MFIKGCDGKFSDRHDQQYFDQLKEKMLAGQKVMDQRIDSAYKSLKPKKEYYDLIRLSLDQSKALMKLNKEGLSKMITELYEYILKHHLDIKELDKYSQHATKAVTTAENAQTTSELLKDFNSICEETVIENLKADGIDDSNILNGFREFRKAHKKLLDEAHTISEKLQAASQKYPPAELKEFTEKWAVVRANLAKDSFDAKDIRALQSIKSFKTKSNKKLEQARNVTRTMLYLCETQSRSEEKGLTPPSALESSSKHPFKKGY